MKIHQRLIIHFLNLSLFNQNSESISSYTKNDLEEMIKEAKAHKICGLIFNSLVNFLRRDDNLYTDIYKISVIESMSQIRHFEVVRYALKQLTEKGIKIILLKGSHLRTLYPKPEMRTMSDVDILVNPKDFDLAKDIMVNLGYTANVDNGVHIQFIKKGCMPIELHRRLTNELYNLQFSENFENRVWDGIVPFLNYGIPLYTLKIEDNLIFLMLHMAEHMIDSGFGIRQVCDIALFITHNKEINWDEVIAYAQMFKLEKFLYSILSICLILFNIRVPDDVSNFCNKNRKYIDCLVDEIFDSGVFGKKNYTRIMVNKFAQYGINKNKENFKIFINEIKENIAQLNYVRMKKILLPIAWLHCVVKVVIKKITTLYESNINRVFSNDDISVRKAYKQRVKTIRWLNIK